MNNQIQVVLKSSTTEMSLNDHDSGIYIVPELNGLTGLPDIRTTSGVNAGYDGGWTSAQNYDARSITLRGVIANEDKASVERMRKQLVSLLGQGKNEELTLDIVTEAGSAYEIQVRTIACEMAMQRVLTQQEFMIQLRADDPLIYDNTEAGEPAIVQVQKALGGFQIPFEIPLAIGGGEDASVIDNHGLEQVAPIVKMYGALHNPKIINQTTNQYMQIEADLGYAEGAYTDAETSDSGQAIEFNAPIAAPLADFSLKGNTEQTTYTGKNLVYTSGKTDGGITATYNATTGETTISGKAERTYAVFGAVADVLPAGTYTFSIQSTAPCAVGVATKATGGSRTGHPISSGSTSTTFTIQQDSAQYDIYITSLTVNTTYNFTFKAMLESGSSATSFEQYVGGTASPNPDYPQAVRTVTGENVVKIRGKNLNEWENVAWSSSTTTSSWCFQNGATRAYGANITSLTKYKITLPAGTYTAKVYDLSSNIINIQVCADGTPNEIVVTSPSNINSSNLSSTITLAEATTVVVRYRTTNPSLGIGNTKLQIEKGSATAYEPYQGQSYEVNLGKNLFDKDNASEVINAFIDTSSHKISTGNSFRLAYIGCEPNTTYTISKTLSARFIIATTSETPANNVSVSQDVAKNTDTTYTITTNSTAKYLCVFLYHASYDTLTPEQILATLQIEKGSTATSYSAYFTPIELCKIGDYQDYIYKDGTDWKIHNAIGKITLDGSLDESIVSGGTATSGKVRFNVTVSGVANIGGSEAASYSNNFVGITRNDTWDCVQGVALGQNLVQIYCEATSGYNLDQFRTWLGSHNTTVYYPLATPTDTTITNAALIEQLDAILNSGRTYAGTNNITTVIAAGNSQGEVQVSYYTHQDPATRDEIVIDSRLRTITLNGLDIYDKKTEGSEFLMLAPGENKLMLQSDIDGDNGYAEVNYKQGYLSI